MAKAASTRTHPGTTAPRRGGAEVRPLVGIVMGSDSDWPVMEQAAKTLERFGVPCEARVL